MTISKVETTILLRLHIDIKGGYPIIKRKLSDRDLSRDWNP